MTLPELKRRAMDLHLGDHVPELYAGAWRRFYQRALVGLPGSEWGSENATFPFFVSLFTSDGAARVESVGSSGQIAISAAGVTAVGGNARIAWDRLITDLARERSELSQQPALTMLELARFERLNELPCLPELVTALH